MLSAMLTALMGSPNQVIQKFAFTEIHMGVEFRLAFYATDRDKAEQAAAAAYARVEQLEQEMSDYRPSSAIRQIKPLQQTPVSKDLWIVLQQAQQVSEQTGGAFDITAGPAVKLWRNARQTGRMPGPIELRQAVSHVGYRFLKLDPANQSVTILKDGIGIDLGGIAKGYACDAALECLDRAGFGRAIVQSGGDIVAGDAPPGSEGWPIQIPGEPTPRILTHCAVSTSGDSEQFVEIGGIRYSHIVDPRTGMGVTNRVTATVLADKGLQSDPLATANCVMGKGGVTDIRTPR